MSSRWIIAFFVVFIPARVFAEPEPIERDAEGRRIWHITDYLKGTPAHIHDLLCNEIHRLDGKVKDAQITVAGDSAAVDNDSRPIVAAYLKTADYQRAKADVAACKKALDKAHADHDTDAAVQAENEYSKNSRYVSDLERAARTAANGNDQVKQDRQHLTIDQGNLQRLLAARAKAVAWHDELVSAIHNSFTLQWPLGEKSEGTLGEIIPISVDSDGALDCICGVREDISVKNSGEGMATARERVHPVEVIIKNANLHASDITLKRPMRYDHNIVVVDGKLVSRNDIEAVLVAEVKHSDIDDLMDAIAQP